MELGHRELAGSHDAYLAGWHAHLDVLAAVAEGAAPPPWREAYAAALAVAR